MHGEAAREAGPGLIAEDLPEYCPRCSAASMTSSVSTNKSTRIYSTLYQRTRRALPSPVAIASIKPATRHIRGERDALRLPGFYRQRIQQNGFQPSSSRSSSLKCVHGGGRFQGYRRDLSGPTPRAAGLGAERGRSRRRKLAGVTNGLVSPERQIKSATRF